MENIENVCTFIGHRHIDNPKATELKLRNIVEKLIVDKKVNTFLFGSKSEFNDLCLKIVTEKKKKYTNIKTIYVRGEFPVIGSSFTEYLKEFYDDTFFPDSIYKAGKARYVERKFYVIECHYGFDLYYMRGKGKLKMEKALSKRKILLELSKLAVDSEVAPNYRIKALELLGKASKMFKDEENNVLGTVKIVDDI